MSSVGKITLDLEIKSDLNKQINSIASAVGDSLKKSMESSTKSMLSGIKESASNGVKSLNSSLKSSLNNTKKILSNILKSFSKSKINIPIDNTISPTSKASPEAKTKRGPPNVGTNIEELKATISNKEALLDNVNNKIEFLQNKLAKLRQQFNSTFNEERKMKIQEQILKTEGQIVSLTGKSDKLGFELADLDKKFKELSESAGKANKRINNSVNSTNSARKSLSSYNNGIANSLKMMFKWMIILPAVAKGVKYLATGLMNNLKTNEQFSNSLAQIKSNLMIAFTPIYNAILPAINTLMSTLSVATQYIASFISSIFGKTYNQSKQATQSLIDAKNAMGVYGDTAAKTAKKIGSLAGFDEINNISDSSDGHSGSTGGGAASTVPTLVTPEVDTSIVDKKMKAFVDKIKSYFKTFDFSNLSKAFDRLKNSVTPTINTIGKVIKWLLENILDPLAKWTISDLLPAFFDLLAETLDFLNPILEVFLELVDWLWEVFLEPIASWTGGVIVDILNGIADALSAIGDWMNEHKEIVENFIIIIGSFAAAWGLVTLALNAWNIAVGIWNVVGGIGAAVTTAFGVAVNILTAPITLVILAIGALIAIVVLLIRNWNTVKVVAANCWAEIKKVWNTVASWFKANVITPLVNFFSNLWTSIKNTFSSVKTWFTNMFTGAWNGIKNAFSAVGGFFGNVWNGIKNVFSTVTSWFTSIFTGAWNGIKSAFSSVSSFFRGIWNTIKSMFTNIGTTIGNAIGGAFKNVVNSIITFAENTINGFIRAINGAIGLINKIPGVNIKQISTLNIPKLAKGGIIDSPTLAMVGERGKEAVMPLENNTGWITNLATQIASILGTSRNSINTEQQGGDIIFMIDGSVIGKVALKELRKMQRQGGITIIPT